MNHKVRNLVFLALLYLAGFIFMANTSPRSLPIALLILPFIYLFILVFFTALYLTKLAGWSRSSRLIALIMSVFVVLLFVLGSIHQLNAKDVLLSLIITTLLSWYIIKTRN